MPCLSPLPHLPPPLPALSMPCIFPDAPHALTHARLGELGNHLGHALQTISSVASALLSFESLVVVSLIVFLFLGGALSMFFLWSIITESDDYDDCERNTGRGIYYTAEDGHGRWLALGMAVPVILVDRNRPMKRPPAVVNDPPRAGKRQ
ncbi:hypothetical protein B0H16DRAFT_1528700 [Mycena metata]|uniref:Uncharacterized protein n=1 Tax=Mycena metata TaxID=1033252 RepID=A0AAD7NJP7_9AGAR|nr:hypothetical protein B0H16DRAFT_1528700 [Mycena metata]